MKAAHFRHPRRLPIASRLSTFAPLALRWTLRSSVYLRSEGAPVAGCRLPKPRVFVFFVSFVLTAVFVSSAQQEAPYTYAITGARIVPVSSAPIDNATIVFSDGVITQV